MASRSINVEGETTVAKRIVLLSDGTGNSAAKLFKSNVWRTYQALDLSQGDQIASYNDGVGNSSFKPLAILGGAFGWGLKRNVLDLYLFLCRNYIAGDEIYCFGFSRGAFTIRILAGLIATRGIVSANSELELRTKAISAFRTFYSEHFRSALGVEKIGRWIRDLFTGEAGAKTQSTAVKQIPVIRFVGLWDTVAAYGLPIDELTRAWSWIFPLSIPNRTPLASVGSYCHALALDDERNTFHPVLLNEPPKGPHNVKQVWFAGMHSNVGGGYPDDGLSYVPLEWMLTEASAADLRFKPTALAEIRELKDPLGRVYDSRRGLGGFYRYQPRRMEWLLNDTSDPDNQVVIPRPKIHESVVQRIQKGVDRYAPIVLPQDFDVVDTAGAVLTPHPESAEQAAQRFEQQENIWDRVWWKRVTYFLSIGVSLALLAFPLYLPATETCETASCVVSPMIRWAGVVLPGFASPWIRAFESHPACFLGLVGLFVFLLKNRRFDPEADSRGYADALGTRGGGGRQRRDAAFSRRLSVLAADEVVVPGGVSHHQAGDSSAGGGVGCGVCSGAGAVAPAVPCRFVGRLRLSGGRADGRRPVDLPDGRRMYGKRL